jgi:hypothetical protein
VKKIYSIFGPLLTALLTLHIILSILLVIYYKFNSPCPIRLFNVDLEGKPILPIPPPPWHQNLVSFLGNHMATLTLIIFIVSLAYYILGCSNYLFTRFGQKQKGKRASGKIFVLRGVFGMAIISILYFILQLISGLSGIC